MTPTSTPLGPDSIKEIIGTIPKASEEGLLWAISIIWNSFLVFLRGHWFTVMLGLFIVFFVVTLKAMFGRWGALGSFLYNLFYFGTLFIIVLIWGPEVFINDVFNSACAIILYPLCYKVVGIVLDKIGVRDRR